MKSLLSAPLNLSISTTPRNFFEAFPCLLPRLLFTGYGANHSAAAPTGISTPAAGATPIGFQLFDACIDGSKNNASRLGDHAYTASSHAP